MLKIRDALTLNKYGQDILNVEVLLKSFSELNTLEKRNYLKEIIALILQSKPKEEGATNQNKKKAEWRNTPCRTQGG